jgi:hypothetical protein
MLICVIAEVQNFCNNVRNIVMPKLITVNPLFNEGGLEYISLNQGFH